MATTDRKELAEKIVKILESASGNQELASLFASIEKINHRLDKLEATQQIPRTVFPRSEHPSLQKFAVVEAAAESHKKEKTCTFEPNDRPCDHCSMCSARGF